MLLKKKNLVIVCIFSFFSPLLFLTSASFTKKINANQLLFYDDFSSGNSSKWTEINGSGGWSVIDNEYVGTVTLIRPENPAFSFAGDSAWQNYIFELDIKAVIGVDKSVLFRHQNNANTYVLNIRNYSTLAGGNDIVFKKVKKSSSSTVAWIPFNNYLGTWYHLKIVCDGPNIKIFVDDELKIDYIETEDILKSGNIGLQIWPGGHTNGDGDITTIAFDNVKIFKIDSSINSPIILLPGLGGSWNNEAMILGKQVPQEDWRMTPFVHVYDNIIQTLENAGYTQNDNLFIFNYDWTKPVDLIAQDLDSFIDRNIGDNEVDLIGHSLGGMVSRAYIQNNPDNNVDQLITVGSPHKGAVKIYYSWEGGDLKNSVSSWERIPAGLLLHINKTFSATNKDAVRKIFPGFENLLPTFNYLKENGIEKEVSNMNEQNHWLNNLDSLVDNNLTDKTSVLVGTNTDTLRWISIEEPNWLDKILGLWPDGKPTGEIENDSGDITVLAESARLDGADIFELDSINHRGLIRSIEGQQKIVDILGLSPTEIASDQDTIYEPSLFFKIASPATIMVEKDDGSIFSGDDFVFIPNAAGNYTLTLTGNGNGSYQLFAGQITKNRDIWKTYSGMIANGQEISYQFSFDPQNPSENLFAQSQEALEGSVREKLSLLKNWVNENVGKKSSKRSILSQLNSAIRYFDRGYLENSIKYLYKTRYYLDYLYLRRYLEENENIYIKNKLMEIINDLEGIYTYQNKNKIYSTSALNREKNFALRYYQQLERKLSSSSSRDFKLQQAAISYSLARERILKQESEESYFNHINYLGVIYLCQEGLKMAR